MLGLKVFFLLVFTMANFKKFEAQVENDQNVEACEPITGLLIALENIFVFSVRYIEVLV